VLELESTDKVLVITRVTTSQMNAIVPVQGALCYNTDLKSVHYYDGTQWVNIGESTGGGESLTDDAIVNMFETIEITPTATGSNIEVRQESISTEQIKDGSINGVDIQPNSIGPGLIQNGSVTKEKLATNSVGADELDTDSFGIGIFTNDAGYVTAGDVRSTDLDNAISIGSDGGVFYDDNDLIDNIIDNTIAINAIGVPNLNEVLQQGNNAIDLKIVGLATPTNPADAATKKYVDDAVAVGGTDDQNLTLNGNMIEIEDGNTIDLTPILAAGGSDDQNLTLNGNMIEIEDGNTIDLSTILANIDTDDQNAGEVPYDPTTSGLTATDTQAAIDEIVATGGGDDDQTAGEVPYDPTTSGLTATDTQAAIDEIVATGGGDDDQTAAEVPYDPTTSGLTATDTQAAIDEIVATGGGDDDQTAAEVPYNPTTSGLTATDTQAAIDEIAAAGNNEQSITLDPTTNQIDLLNDDDAINSSIKLDATTIEAFDNGNDIVIQLADEAVTLEKINPNGADDGDVLQWSDTGGALGTGGWETSATAGHTGTAKSIFFADTDGTPTTADDNTNTLDDRGFYWDTDGRTIGPNSYGALFIGLEGTNEQSNKVKVHIADNFPGFTYALQLQNYNATQIGRTTGILFSTEGTGSYGRGALVYEYKANWARGDFHFLQRSDFGPGTNENPDLTHKAFTIKNNSDIVLYGGIEINGTGAGTGIGTAGQVLASDGPGNPVKWIANGGTTPTDTDANDGLSTYVAATGYNINVDNTTIEINADALRIKPSAIDPVTPVTQVLTTDKDSGAIEWKNFTGATIPTGTAGSIFFSDGAGALVENAAQISFDNVNDRLNLGGGFTTNEQKLNVQGNARATAFLGAVNGANPAFRFFDDADTGMYSQGVDQLTLKAGDQDIITIRETLGNGNQITANGALELEEELIDITGNEGAAGEVLTSTGAGVAWSEPVIFSMGKIIPAGTNNINGASLTGSLGNYKITFTTARTDPDYIIQLTVVGNYRIFVTDQTMADFDVSILTEDGSVVMTPLPTWYYTVSDF
jgi:hypothetical protein